MPPAALELSKRFMRNPIRILVKQEELTLEGIRQFYILLEDDSQKFGTISDLYDTINVTQAVLFCNTRRRVEELSNRLNEAGHTVSSTHSALSANDRNVIMQEFRSGYVGQRKRTTKTNFVLGRRAFW